jgi:benzylsuccinate CoA-transferase BbsF subunit
MSGFGLTGPQRDYVSYGPTLQALAGFTACMREAGGEPTGWGYSYADMAAGHAAALATLAALHHRRHTGRGQLVDLSQFENTCALVGPVLLDASANGRAAPAAENRSQERDASPYGVYPCRGDDRWCAITVVDDAQWMALCRVLGDPPWTRDPALATTAGRVARAAALDRALAASTRACDAAELTERLQKAGVPAGIVADAVDLCTRTPQLAARGYWSRVATPEGETVILDGLAAHLSATPGYVTAPGPLLGEHTEHVLADVLGISADAITQLRQSGAIA